MTQSCLGVAKHGQVFPKSGKTMKNESFPTRLRYALAGLAHAFRTENSVRVHAVSAALVIAALVFCKPAPLWWAILGLTIAVVSAAELFNTALEQLADHLHPERHPRIKVVKDCAAAAVLMVSIGALCVAAAFVCEVWGDKF
jgi:undecaprenol kinase